MSDARVAPHRGMSYWAMSYRHVVSLGDAESYARDAMSSVICDRAPPPV
ncbi:MAG: hypothetical protein ACXW2C_06205 [Acidimicrobiia bacterium]